MRLSDIMSRAGLAGYAEVAVIIFFTVFVAVVFHTFRRSRREELEEAARIPLDDDIPAHERDHRDETEVTP